MLSCVGHRRFSVFLLFLLVVGGFLFCPTILQVIFLCLVFRPQIVSDLKSRSDLNPMCSYKANACCALLMFQYACCCLCWWRGCGVFAVQVDAEVFIEVYGLADVGRVLFIFVVGERVACGVPFNVPTFVRVVRKSRSSRYRFPRASVYVVVFTEQFRVCASCTLLVRMCPCRPRAVPCLCPCPCVFCAVSGCAVPCRYVPRNAVLLRVVP